MALSLKTARTLNTGKNVKTVASTVWCVGLGSVQSCCCVLWIHSWPSDYIWASCYSTRQYILPSASSSFQTTRQQWSFIGDGGDHLGEKWCWMIAALMGKQLFPLLKSNSVSSYVLHLFYFCVMFLCHSAVSQLWLLAWDVWVCCLTVATTTFTVWP